MRTLDITSKLNFEESPVLTFKGKSFTLDDSAPAVLKIMELLGDTPTMADMIEAGKIVFGGHYEEMVALCGNFRNFTKVLEAAMDLIMGEDVGEPVATASTTFS